MTVDRRDFMKSVGAGATLAAVPSVGLASTGKRWSQAAEIAAEDLLPHVGQPFQVKCPDSDNSIQLMLKEVVTNRAWERTQTGEPRPSEFRQPFSLIFTSVGSQVPADGCYDISHPNLKTANLYLSRKAEREFEVCFS